MKQAELESAIDAVNRHASEKHQGIPVPDATKLRMIRVVKQAPLTPTMFEETFMYSVPSGIAKAICRTSSRTRGTQILTEENRRSYGGFCPF